MANKKSPKNPLEFFCKSCDYYTCNSKDYKKHLVTMKHKRLTMANKNPQKSPDDNKFICQCGKAYTHASSLSKHSKKCKMKISDILGSTEEEKMSENKDVWKVIDSLVAGQRESNEMVKKVIEASNNKQTIINNTINGNINNNNFNINMFLNEKCNGAINLSDFIENIEVSQIDLENNAQLGFVDGISKIFIDNLKQLSIYERPIHCTDQKREIMYIKDQDTWTKENNDLKIRDAIQEVSRKSMLKLNDWKTENPDYNDMNSDFSNKCIAIHQQSNAGENRETFYPKVIKTIAKESSINRDTI